MRFESILNLLTVSSWPAVIASAVADVFALDDDLPRLVVYFQTTHDSMGRPISMLPLVYKQGIALTHLIVCSFHLSGAERIHLNDFPPDDARFRTLWAETKVLQRAGVKIMGMVGGAAFGSYAFNTLGGAEWAFENAYRQLYAVITKYGLQGVDLDVEQWMSLANIERLIRRLRQDFGTSFIVTLAPVASDMRGQGGLSGFDYTSLDQAVGDLVSFYNVQFYSGFGSMNSPVDFAAAVSHGFSPDRLVAGQLTSPQNGNGFTDFPHLNATMVQLRRQYGEIGGIMGWEYFNSWPGGTKAPWQWAQEMTEILRPGLAPKLSVTSEQARHLEGVYWESHTGEAQPRVRIMYAEKANYQSLIN